MTTHYLQIERNMEGDKLAIMSPMDENGKLSSGYRISGPKAWGGSETLADIKISTEDFVQYIKDYAPDVLKQLCTNVKV